ncbi:hypothetical protein FACS18942_05790 [Planctomycetales bacterium]|nr:hypothetical protein FACS18942_05790 [Planctomycetales bacterium]
MKKNYLPVFFTLLLVFVFAGLPVQQISAQQRPVGRFVQRILNAVNGGSEYRVEPSNGQNAQQQNTAPQNEEGRIAENVLGIVQQFVQNSSADAKNTALKTALKPVAVISLASFNEFKHVAHTVAERIRESENIAEEPAALNSFLSFYETLVKNGFDTEQPAGFILQTDGLLYYPLFFTPLNLDSNFGKNLQERYTETTADGRTVLKTGIIPYPFGTLYVRQHNGWVFIATEKQLNSLPDDPSVLLEGLGKEKLLAARFYLDNLPKLTTGTALAFAEMQAVQKAQNEAEKASARLFISYLRSLAEQASFLEYSLYYDEKEGDYVIQQKETVKPGTEQAKLLAQRRNAASPLHGFYYPENAALAGHFCMLLTKAQRVNLETLLKETLGKQLLTEDEQKIMYAPAAQTEDKKQEPVQKKEEQKDAAQKDHRDVLAELLAKEHSEEQELDNLEEKPAPLPELELSTLPNTELTKQQKTEIILRRLAACYYWGLLGSVRSGKFDTAFTVSQEHGILGSFTVEDERFQKTLDEVFAEIAVQFPDVYQQTVNKDYDNVNGFKLTKISFVLSDLLQESPLRFLFPSDNNREQITVILGVHKKMVCFAVSRGGTSEQELKTAILASEKALPVYDVFFVYSAYEIGQMFADAGNSERFRRLKQVFANQHPEANAYAEVEWFKTGKNLTGKVITLRVSDLLTPSVWRLGRNRYAR